jgi:hypothetical protein
MEWNAAVNVFGDAIGAAIVDHWEAKKYEDLESDDAFAEPSSKDGSSSSSIGTHAHAHAHAHTHTAALRMKNCHTGEDPETMTPLFSSERVYPHYQTTQGV